MQPFVTVSNTCMRNKAASHFLARFLSVICFGLYLMPSKSMWQSKSVIRKKVFFCPHVKQIQHLMETISFQAMVFSCSVWRMFGNSLRTRQLVWDDRQSRRHVAVNQGLQCVFDVRLSFWDLRLNYLFKSSNIKTCQWSSARCAQHGKPHNLLFLYMWKERLPAHSLSGCHFWEKTSISQGLTIHLTFNLPTYWFIFEAKINSQ